MNSQENPSRANGQIFNVGNPNNEVTVRQLAEMMTQVNSNSFFTVKPFLACTCLFFQVTLDNFLKISLLFNAHTGLLKG